MRDEAMFAIDECISRYEKLAPLRKDFILAVEILIEAYKKEHVLFTCGNGGSAADAQHIVGELMKSFTIKRRLSPYFKEKIEKLFPNDSDYFMQNIEDTLPALSLVGEAALLTAFSNDVKWDLAFAQSLFGLGKKGDVLLAISTSGNSKNVLYCAKMAKIKDMHVIALTGNTGGMLKDVADVTLLVPEKETFKIQELHLPIYHAMCIALEREFFLKN